FVDNTVAQDFQTADWNIKNYNNFVAGKIWADFDAGDGCARGSSKGAIVDNASTFHADYLSINGAQTGIIFQNASSNQFTQHINDLFFNAIGQDCVSIISGGRISIDNIATNVGTGNCGRYAVNYADTSGATFLKIGKIGRAHV